MATLIVPAAGEGSRLGGNCPKALVDLDGRPLIEWVLSAAEGSVERIVVVIQPGQQPYFDEWAAGAQLPAEISWAYQRTPEGSLAAVRIGVESARELDLLEPGIIIVWSDQVGVGRATVRLLSDSVATDRKLLAVPVFETSALYVWVELDEAGRIGRVMRTRDGDVPPASGLADLGIFGLSKSLALDLLGISHEARGDRELDFTYALPVLSELADVTLLPKITEDSQLLAVNTPQDLNRARDLFGRRND